MRGRSIRPTGSADDELLTELGFLIVSGAGALFLAAALLRWLVSRERGGAPVRRVAEAVSRAVDAVLWSAFPSAALVLVALFVPLATLVLVLARSGLLDGGALAYSGTELLVWSALAAVAGALAALLMAFVAGRVSVGTASRVLASSRSGGAELEVAVRGAAGMALLVDGSALLVSLGVALLPFAVKGGLRLPAPAALTVASASGWFLLPAALGAVAVSLVLARVTGAFRLAADVAADVGGERNAGLDPDDTRNPALIADIVGDQVGGLVARSVHLFALMLGAHALLGVSLAALAARWMPASIAGLLALPLVVRGLSPLAAGLGVLAARTGGSAWLALARSGLVTVAALATGAVGASVWLLGEPHGARLGGAVAAGLLVITGAALALGRRVNGRLLREVAEAGRAGAAPPSMFGLLVAGEHAAAVVGALLVAVLLCTVLPGRLGLPEPAIVGPSLLLALVVAALPLLESLTNVASIADAALAMARMREVELGVRAQERLSELDRNLRAASFAPALCVAVGGGAALLLTLAPLFPQNETAAASWPLMLAGGGAGAIVVLLSASAALRSSLRTAIRAVAEVERQLRGFAREGGAALVPRDFTPSYRACVDLTLRAASERAFLAAWPALLAPPLVGALGWLAGDARLARPALLALAVSATATGALLALSADATATLLGAARRTHGQRGTSVGFASAVDADAFGDACGHSAAPAARHAALLCALIAVLLLTLLP